MEQFGAKLKALRKRNDMTMKELAYALDISAHSYISKLENAEKIPSVEKALKISRLFNISLDQLLKDELDIPEF